MSRQKLESVTLNPQDLAALVAAAVQAELAKVQPQTHQALAAKANAKGSLNLTEPTRDGKTFPPIEERFQPCRSNWVAEAGERLIQVGGKDGPCVVAQPKVLSQGTGKLGWYVSASGVVLKVGDRALSCRIQTTITVEGSDPRSKEEREELARQNARKLLEAKTE